MTITKTLKTPFPELQPGSLFADRYEIITELGKGGMGTVYKAQDTRLERTVALKLLPQEQIEDKSAKKRFEREAKAAASLNHPNITVIHEIDKDLTFIAMEYIEGQSLKEKIEADPISIEDVIEITEQIANGLEEAHKKSIVHRDIKPANIMLTPSGRAKIVDFGIAILGDKVRVTQPGSTLGTTAYMSPEQIKGEAVDLRTDIWSLGIVLYEMLTGNLPFIGERAQEVMYAVLNKEPKSQSSFRTDIPKHIEDVVKKTLEKDANNRYQNIQEFLSDLKQSGPIAITKKEKSIVVLPFKNMSPEAGQEYFCDGLTEELINALFKIKELKVVARTSAFAFKGKDVDIRDVGRQLNVETALEGSVRKAGNQLRITAQLINISDGYHLWSDRFDYEMANVFEIQDKITLTIVDKLKIQLGTHERGQIVKKSTKNVEAYNLYLKGRYLINLLSEDSFDKGLECFNQAIALDPGYAIAYTGLAEYYIYIGWYGVISPIQAFEKARGFIEKALELDSHLPEAHYNDAILKFVYEWDWKAAERAFEYALELNPSNPSSYYYYSCYLVCLCRYDDAIEISREMVELDPLSPVTNLIHGWVLFEADRFDDSIQQLKKALELNPGLIVARQEIAWNYAFQRKCKQALAVYEKMDTADMGIAWGKATRACVYALCGRKDEALKIYEEMLQLAEQRYIDAAYLASISSVLGEKDQGLEWLSKAYKERSVLMVYLKNYAKSWFKNISSDPRYKELLGKVGFKP